MGAIKVWNGTSWQTAVGGGGATTYVGSEPPSGTPTTGDMWYDTDHPGIGVTLPVAVQDGGTGAENPVAARTNLAVPGIPVIIAEGGTGATTASTARTNLAVPDLPVTIAQGGTGATTAPTARTALAVPAIGNSAVTAGAPTTGTWARGDQWLDSANVVWICITAGTPGTWTFVGTNVRMVRRLPAVGIQLVNPTSYTFLPDTNERNAVKLAFTKRTATSRLIVTFTVHFYIAAGAAQQWWGGLNNGTMTWDITTRWCITAAQAYHDLVGQNQMSGLAAGDYIFEPVFKSATTATMQFDQNWEIAYSIQEVP